MSPLRAIPALVATSFVLCSAGLKAGETPAPAAPRPVPVIHVTDLFRPHNDPDDHWDLATVYALAYQGRLELRGVMIDYPRPEWGNDPDVLAVAQLNYLTGKAVPVLVGSPRWYENPRSLSEAAQADLKGVRAMLEILRSSPEPVVINILGSCRDVALAGRLAPEVFAQKCRAIYLNAGSGTRDPAQAKSLEWNVSLDPPAYAAIFELPCPVYWMPCFDALPPAAGRPARVGPFGTFYRFRQGDVLAHLSPAMQNYFAYMFLHGRALGKASDVVPLRPDWLHVLLAKPDPALMERLGAMDRAMWCTAGFLHAAGLTVTAEGNLLPLAQARQGVFSFDPVAVSCSREGITIWEPAEGTSNRFIFHVRDVARYEAAMTAALRTVLARLP